MLKSRGTGDNGRNYFDLTNRHAYGMKSGYITPLKCLHTIPDDYFDVNVQDFTQTDAMTTAAFMRGRKEIAGYFVPYNTIWHNFNQYQSTREDPQSVLLKDKGILFEPRISRWNLVLPAIEFFVQYLICERYLKWVNNPGKTYSEDVDYSSDAYYKWQKARSRYLDTKYNYQDGVFCCPYVTRSHVGLDDSTLPIIGFFSFYNDTSKEIGEILNRDVLLDTVGEWKWCNYLRKLDMLGYGNYYPLFALAEQGYLNFLSDVAPTGETTDENVIQAQEYLNSIVFNLALKLLRICKADKTITRSTYYDRMANSADLYVSVYPLYAYNHIFYTMFRNSYYDLSYDVRNFNVDFLNCSTLQGSIVTLMNIPTRWFNLECHQWKKDKFTSLMPDTQFGAVSSLSLSLPNIGGDVGTWHKLNGSSVSQGVVNVGSGQNVSVYHSSFSEANMLSHHHVYDDGNGHALTNPSVSFNVLALKRAEALQQYRQDLLRAGNHTQDIFKQIYGASPKSQLDEHSYFVDVAGGDVIVDPVVSTASTGDSVNGSLGDIAARAIINTGGKFKLSVSDFGCFIFLAYIVPESMYNSYMLDQHLMNLTQEDHFIPQLMNLGFEPIVTEALNGLSASPHVTRGFSLPYIEFKTDVDMCHGNYCDFYDETDNANEDYSSRYFPEIYEGSKSHWVAPRTDMQLQDVTTLRNFYIDPRVLNNLFLVASDCTYETDQFTCYTAINVDSTRPLSELGLPRFC